MTEQQKHLKNALDQQKQLQVEINTLNEEINTKQKTILLLEGIVQYLKQIGVSISDENSVEIAAEEESSDEY
jgi:hypothetical protein